jgi:dihydrofolate synthase/folylpolyglutamate synthase
MYQQALDYLLNLPMFQRVGNAALNYSLDKITAIAAIVGNPHQQLKCIHIAGTNGKGSVTHIIASILQEQGYKVGVYVSPHYKDYRERIKINGKYISKAYITKFIEQYGEDISELQPSFFEATTALAFKYFADKKVDYCVIETGLGGRFDASNIITPLLSVITNISYDHTHILGNTLPEIAFEKAGIIKPNVPVVIGEGNADINPVFEKKAKETSSTLYHAPKVVKPKDAAKYKTGLHGAYQSKNIVTALAAIEILKQSDIVISAKAIKKGLLNVAKNTSFIGRWMVVNKAPLTVYDSAHNEAGLWEVVAILKQTKHKQLHIVYGTVSDKDITKNLSLLPRNAAYYFCKPNIPRGLDVSELAAKASENKLKGDSYKSVKAAFNAAKKNANKGDMILVTGSIFVVAEVI